VTKQGRLCVECQQRPARFRSHGRRSDGRVRADKDHDLCPQCYRGVRNRLRARALADADSQAVGSSDEDIAPFGPTDKSAMEAKARSSDSIG